MSLTTHWSQPTWTLKLFLTRLLDHTWKRAPGRPLKKWTDQLRNNNTPVAPFGDMQSTTAILEWRYDFRRSSDNDWLNLLRWWLSLKFWNCVEGKSDFTCKMNFIENLSHLFDDTIWQELYAFLSDNLNGNCSLCWDQHTSKIIFSNKLMSMHKNCSSKECYWKTFECKMVWGHNAAVMPQNQPIGCKYRFQGLCTNIVKLKTVQLQNA